MHSRRCISDISGILERDAEDGLTIPAALAALQTEARAREIVLRCFDGEIVICDTVVEEDEASPCLMVTADGKPYSIPVNQPLSPERILSWYPRTLPMPPSVNCSVEGSDSKAVYWP